jgi:hypothetical protein
MPTPDTITVFLLVGSTLFVAAVVRFYRAIAVRRQPVNESVFPNGGY